MRCNWCGKESGNSFCSNKCIAESDSYNGISRAERAAINAKARNAGETFVTIVAAIISIFIVAFIVAMNSKQTGASSKIKNRPSDNSKVPYGNVANNRSDDWYCRYCKKIPSQTDGLTCYSAKEPYLHSWVKFLRQ